MAADPRLDADQSSDTGERDVMPVVKRSRSGVPGWIIGAGVAVLALFLFGVLDARRRSLQTSAVTVRTDTNAALPSAPPLLAIPPEAEPVVSPPPPVMIEPAIPRPAPIVQALIPVQRHVTLPPVVPPAIQAVSPARPAGSGGTAVVVDTSTPRTPATGNGGANPANAAGGVGSTDRARASMFANRATTVPQGTLIPAVLETAFNSTRAGFARALVQRDVASFDGSRVLIPRGSRLIGEYRSDATVGQSRALVIWNRLVRPDGAVIALASPAADPLGRGGVKASVNNHFFERFSGAILQSALDVGVNLASRSSNSPVILALPGTAQSGLGQLARPTTTIQPTLSVKAGTSIGVFVARDLDFTDVETER